MEIRIRREKIICSFMKHAWSLNRKSYTIRNFGKDFAFIGFAVALPKYQRPVLYKFDQSTRTTPACGNRSCLSTSYNECMDGLWFCWSYTSRRSRFGEVPLNQVQLSHHFEETSELRVRQTDWESIGSWSLSIR